MCVCMYLCVHALGMWVWRSVDISIIPQALLTHLSVYHLSINHLSTFIIYLPIN